MSCYSKREKKKKKQQVIQPEDQLALHTGKQSSEKLESGAIKEFIVKEKSLLSVHKRTDEVLTAVLVQLSAFCSTYNHLTSQIKLKTSAMLMALPISSFHILWGCIYYQQHYRNTE